MAQVGLLEDNARIAKLCTTMLQYAGHQVTVYPHPRDCLCTLLASSLPWLVSQSPSHSLEPIFPASLPIDVLILDLHLPDIDGMEVLYLLRSDDRTASLPLIFCTAASASEITSARRLAPTAGIVEKPFSFRDLTAAIAHALSSQRD